MIPTTTPSAPKIEVSINECKGCQLCVSACPRDVIFISPKLNDKGFYYAEYSGDDCNGCGICFYACPEPGAITVYKKGHESH